MKRNRNKSIIFAFSIVALLVLGSIGSFGVSKDFVTKEHNIQINKISKNIETVSIKNVITTQITSTIQTKNSNSQNIGSLDFNTSENILVSGEPENETYPAMAVSGVNSLVAYDYDGGNAPRIFLRNSKDFGQTWSNAQELVDWNSGPVYFNSTSPALCTTPVNNQAFGAFVSPDNNYGIYGFFEISNIAADLNPPLGNVGRIDWSYWENTSSGDWFWWSDFSNPDIVYHDNADVPWIIGLIGSTNYTDPDTGDGPCTNSIMFHWRDHMESGSYWISWDPELEYCSNLSLDMEDTATNLYGICEIKNGSNQDLLYFSGYHEIISNDPPQSNLVLQYQQFIGPENLTHPQILVNDDQIYIVAERNSQEIVLINSSDDGGNWSIISITSDILPPGSSPQYPLFNVNETHLACIFTESGNISFTSSVNEGINWSDPLQLNTQNGSVVEGYRYHDFPDMDHVVWTDDRNGNNDIYSAIKYIPETDLMIIPESVYLSNNGRQFLLTNNWIHFIVRNNGNLYVEDVPIEITYARTGKEPKHTEYQAYITYLAGNGAEKQFKKPLFVISLIEFISALFSFRGVQNITIEVDPHNIIRDNDRSNNIYTLENVNYSTIFPRLKFF